MTAPTILHKLLVTNDLHPPAIESASDPGAVGAGIWWKDTALATPVLKQRNGTNTAWLTLGILLPVISTEAAGDVASLVDVGGGVLAVQWLPPSLGLGDLADLQFVRKTANESVFNSTLQDDDHLTLAVGANQTWLIELNLIATAKAEADIKFTLVGPAGAAGWWGGVRVESSIPTTTLVEKGNFNARTLFDGSVTLASGAIEAEKAYIHLRGLIRTGGTAGNLKLQWSQLTTESGVATVVYADSYMVLRRVT